MLLPYARNTLHMQLYVAASSGDVTPNSVVRSFLKN
jgi:hypothetical protein